MKKKSLTGAVSNNHFSRHRQPAANNSNPSSQPVASRRRLSTHSSARLVALLLVLSTLQVMVAFGPSTRLADNPAQAATTTSGTLTVGGTTTAPNGGLTQNLGTSSVISQSNWNNITNASGANTSGFDSGGYLTQNFAVIYSNYQWGMSNFNPTLNMASPMTFSVPEKNNSNTTLNAANTYGNWQGVYFIPANTTSAQITTAGNQNTSNSSSVGLGIGGIPNSVFAGRDFYYNSSQKDYLGNGFSSTLNAGVIGPGYSYAGNQISIRTTGSDGALTAGTAATSADASSLPVGGETLKVAWTPNSTNAITYDSAGKPLTVTGTLVLTVGTTSVTYQNKIMQAQMTMGLNSSNGGWGSAASYNIPSATLSTNANQAGSITVNYQAVDANGNVIKSLGSSTISNANCGDLIGVTSGTANSVDTYDYSAPTITGYAYKSSGSSVAVNCSASTPTNPSITVSYTASPENVVWIYNWAFNTTGAFPAAGANSAYLSYSTTYGSALTNPGTVTATSAPAGYHIALVKDNGSHYLCYPGSSKYQACDNSSNFVDITKGVKNPAGTSQQFPATIQGLQDAAIYEAGSLVVDNPKTISSKPIFNNAGSDVGGLQASAFNNIFNIYLESNQETATFTYKYVTGTPSTAPALPSVISETGGFGGFVGMTYTTLSATQTTGNGTFDSNLVTKPPTGYTVQSITAPNGTSYTGVTAFTAPTATSTGSVSLTVLGSSTPATLTIPKMPLGYDSSTPADGVPDGAITYPNSSTNLPTLIQALSYAFPYGDSAVSGSSSNQFTINLAALIPGTLNYKPSSTVPGVGSTPGQLQGWPTSGSFTGTLPGGAEGSLIKDDYSLTSTPQATAWSQWPATAVIPTGYTLVPPIGDGLSLTSSTAGIILNKALTTTAKTPGYVADAVITPTGLTFGNVDFGTSTISAVAAYCKAQGISGFGIVSNANSAFAPVDSTALNPTGGTTGNPLYSWLISFQADGTYKVTAMNNGNGISKGQTPVATVTLPILLQLINANYSTYNGTVTSDNYTTAVLANTLRQTWTFKYADGSSANNLPNGGGAMSLVGASGNTAASTVANPSMYPQAGAPKTGAPLQNNALALTDPVNGYSNVSGVKTLPAGTAISGYQYAGSSSSDPADSTVYPTFAALAAKHPYVLASSATVTSSNITVLVSKDKTALSAKNDSIVQGHSYLPLTDLIASNNFDGSANGSNPSANESADSTINGTADNVVATIRNKAGAYIGGSSLGSDGKTPLGALDPSASVSDLSLPVGTYTISYYTLNSAGTTAYNTWLTSKGLSASAANLSTFIASLNGQLGAAGTGSTLFGDYTTATNSPSPAYVTGGASGAALATTASVTLTVTPLAATGANFLSRPLRSGAVWLIALGVALSLGGGSSVAVLRRRRDAVGGHRR